MEVTQENDFLDELEELSSAQEFLAYFHIEYDAGFVEKKHIQLLRLYQKLLSAQPNRLGDFAFYQSTLRMAYKQLLLGRELALNTHGGCDTCQSGDCPSSMVEEER